MSKSPWAGVSVSLRMRCPAPWGMRVRLQQTRLITGNTACHSAAAGKGLHPSGRGYGWGGLPWIVIVRCICHASSKLDIRHRISAFFSLIVCACLLKLDEHQHHLRGYPYKTHPSSLSARPAKLAAAYRENCVLRATPCATACGMWCCCRAAMKSMPSVAKPRCKPVVWLHDPARQLVFTELQRRPSVAPGVGKCGCADRSAPPGP